MTNLITVDVDRGTTQERGFVLSFLIDPIERACAIVAFQNSGRVEQVPVQNLYMVRVDFNEGGEIEWIN